MCGALNIKGMLIGKLVFFATYLSEIFFFSIIHVAQVKFLKTQSLLMLSCRSPIARVCAIMVT